MEMVLFDISVLYQTASITNPHRPAQLCSYGTTKRLWQVRNYEKIEVGYLAGTDDLILHSACVERGRCASNVAVIRRTSEVIDLHVIYSPGH
jgi:hypothetical protein